MAGYLSIGDYGIIGDCRSAALVSRDGSIDWLCLPRFDSPSIFAALLDLRQGGCFRVGPTGDYRVTRRYVEASNVLETTFHTPSGVVRLIDVMPVADEETKGRELWPEHEILRRVEGIEGEVEIEVRYEPRLDYGRLPVTLRPHPHDTLIAEQGLVVLLLHSDVPLTIAADQRKATGRRAVRAGERLLFGWSFSHGWPAVMPAEGDNAHRQIDGSVLWWQQWASQFTYDWHYRDAILRSALALKLLTYAPSGAVIAAPTTSLPEEIGGVRNWDYRYCWLRDASLTLRSLLDLGFTVEGEAFLSWLLHATRLTRPKLQILYNVFGGTEMPERHLDHLEGYRGSRPVRVGNGATHQVQLDVYGEVIGAVHEYVIRGGRIDRGTGRLLRGLGETVCQVWRDADEGIWEPRGGKRQNTHSKVMCWVALDRLLKLHQDGHLRCPFERFRRERDAIREQVETQAWDDRLNTYVASYEDRHLDASLLRLSFVGFADPHSERMKGTRRAVDAHLGHGPLLYRYRADDGLPGGEGTFGICGFWGVEACALEGRVDEARERFEALLGYANDLGLFAEEVDPASGLALGNFPQAFTHVGLISAGLTLARCSGRPQEQPAGGGEKI
ncbi:MAG TPA: glycoside hydrolase family 15 protein [Vicinamibacterales bacterium]|nr:glycoside hydrolase family 15 protein [Vicinamibacterales bacterium]